MIDDECVFCRIVHGEAPAEICRDHAIQPGGCPCQHKPVRLTKENPSA